MSTQRGVQAVRITAPEAAIKVDDMQHIEQLAFVFMDTLDLHIEHGIGIEDNAAASFDQRPQPQLVRLLDCCPTRPKRLIVGMRRKCLQSLQLDLPAIANRFRNQTGQLRVTGDQPASRRDAVGLVVEFARPHLVKIRETALR